MSGIKRIIIMDDDPIGIRIGNHVIKRALPGMEVCSFTLPEAGLEFIQTEYLTNPVKTLLFLDINMPMMSGWEVLKKLESYEAVIKGHVLIYICSSSISLHDKALSSKHPLIADFMEKPITKQKLIDIIKDEQCNRNQFIKACSNTEDNIYF